MGFFSIFKDFSIGDLGDWNPQDSLVREDSYDPNTLFQTLIEDKVWQLMDWSGIFVALEKKGYADGKLVLEFSEPTNQIIQVFWKEENLITIRMHVREFDFTTYGKKIKENVLSVDWIQTRHPCKIKSENQLYPGQDVPGLGLFEEIVNFIGYITLSIRVKAAWNRPEFFHDAVLFHKKFRFPDPKMEAKYRCLIRDLKYLGMLGLSTAIHSHKIKNGKGDIYKWNAPEMIHIQDTALQDLIFNHHYHAEVERCMRKYRFSI
ncbi:hypothetical protein [Leptospira sp. GIMC2001]|uniref:hypothetical protein n=1 Tax=Leptospira sp. GIMC2001 TaxID=1513297 RepID=UPI002349FE96|nr:hypothetical protein [Leptospira sp. GIMC2001]WCL48521.1 hypothetical protein O4O04_14600 [Leptospira sp. GIMC2001]